ncbi:isochorismatase family protein [Agromyces protaetiae]|uniref:Isochorismatase family protein n=1 Tax=Agromyces protaetiae TaxID=2509455 RepID=A0A4P6FQN3_9MICO|nr:isochorismatase family protein [Agromyces protaetiae]QAY72838.1 isochorismatase family protein [Agromyces protaetiae]
MTLSTIDPAVALVVIDLQKGIANPGRQTAHPVPEVVANAVRLADAFRERGLPVVLVTVTGGAPGRTEVARAQAEAAAAAGTTIPAWPADFAELLPELEASDERTGASTAPDIRIVKRTWGAFHGTALHDELQARGVTQIVLVGIATSKGVESTARAAHEHGYNVTLALDAMTDSSAAAHEGSVANVFPALGETGTVDEVIALLPAGTGTEASAAK